MNIPDIARILDADFLVPGEWRNLGRALGIQESELKEKENSRETITVLLQTWEGRNGKSVATTENLVDILIKEKYVSAAEQVGALLTVRRVLTYPQAVAYPQGQNSNVREITKHEKYEKIGELGNGKFGQVYKIKCTFTQLIYAMKEIPVEKFMGAFKDVDCPSKRFSNLLQGVKLMAGLQGNQNIVRYQDQYFEGPQANKYYEMLHILNNGGEPTTPQALLPDILQDCGGDTFWCVKMELLDTDLDSWLNNNPEMIGNLHCTKLIIKQLLLGLQYIHQNNVVHNNITPANILLKLHPYRSNPFPILITIGDFVSAYNSKSGPGISVQTYNIFSKCTIFSSPEFISEQKCENTSDIFSLGLVCVRLLRRFCNTQEMKEKFDQVRQANTKIMDDIEDMHNNKFVLIRSMLNSDPNCRPSATICLQQEVISVS